MMAFSDHPDPTRLHYPSAEHYLAYLHSYAKRFGLEEHSRYNAEVVDAQLGEHGLWDVLVDVNGRRGLLKVKADVLVVATGSNSLPNEAPECVAAFQGRMIHSADYNLTIQREIASQQLRVLVVGGGESAADMAAEISSLTKNATVWLRRSIVLAPRYSSPGKEMAKVERNRDQDFPVTTFLEASTTNRLSAAQNVYFYGMFRRLLWHTPIALPTLAAMCLDGTKESYLKNDQAAVVTKNQRMCEAIYDGDLKCIVCPTIKSEDLTVIFRTPDEQILRKEFDLVVLCTGYRPQFPWLNDGELAVNPRKWLLHCFPPEYGSKLAFIGYARPQQGGIPACAEILSRYLALLLRDERQLPVDRNILAQRDEIAERQRFSLRPEMHTLVDYNAFIESVARRIGCEPKLPSSCVCLFNLHMLAIPTGLYGWALPSPQICFWAVLLWTGTILLFFVVGDGLLIKWWLFPQWSVWYRQRGSGADPRLLRETLQRVSIRKNIHVNARFALFIAWTIPTFYVQRYLSVVIFLIHWISDAMGIVSAQRWIGEFRPKLFALHSAIWRFSDLYLP
jgi:dimethylaniline monooxygenase (N-oxide forming)